MRRGASWLVVAAVALCCGAGVARADESFFSITFLGIREETGDGRARGLGVQGVGLGDERTALSLNPASFGRLDRMTLSLIGGGGGRSVSDGTREHEDGDATFPHLRAALPLPGEFVFSAGFMSLRNFRSELLLPRQSVGPYTYRNAFKREGSLYEVPLGLARNLHPRVHVGMTVDLILGTVNESWTQAGDSLLALRTRRRDGMDGTTVTLGVLVDPLKWLRVGIAWSPQIDFDVESRTTVEDGRVQSNANNLRSELLLSSTEYPATWRAGAAAQLGPKWLLTADGLWRDFGVWTGRTYGAPAVGNEWRLGGGIESRPHTAPMTRALAYRLGVSRYQWPQEMGSGSIDETTVAAGLGYDLREGWGRLDAVLEYTRAGSIETNGFEESRWTFLLSLTGQEMWKRKSPRQ